MSHEITTPDSIIMKVYCTWKGLGTNKHYQLPFFFFIFILNIWDKRQIKVWTPNTELRYLKLEEPSRLFISALISLFLFPLLLFTGLWGFPAEMQISPMKNFTLWTCSYLLQTPEQWHIVCPFPSLSSFPSNMWPTLGNAAQKVFYSLPQREVLSSSKYGQ